MKKILLSLFIISTMLTSTISHAGGNFSVNIGLGYGGYGYGHNYGYKNHYRQNSYGGYGHGYGHKYGYSDRYIKFGHSNRHNSGYRKYKRHNDHLAGALVLGGLVGYGISRLYANNHYRKNHYDRSNYLPRTYKRHTTNIVSRKHQSAETALPARRLHKDINGNCFEIKNALNGDELKIELDPLQCDW